jgi:hypothetical protein
MKAGPAAKPLRRRWISSFGVCQRCNLHDAGVARCTFALANRPRTHSGTHVYFGLVTAMQTAIDHVGVARCAAVRAGHGDSRGRLAGWDG